MALSRDDLELPDEQLLKRCDVHIYKASGPGGQHRNKVSSAVRLRHRETGITAHGDDSRSQHENKRLAIKRLRMNFALQIRRPVDPETPPSERLGEFLLPPPKGLQQRRLQIGRKNPQFWQVAAVLLDELEACEGRIGEAAGRIGVTTGNLVRTLSADRHLLAAAQEVRRKHGHRPIS